MARSQLAWWITLALAGTSLILSTQVWVSARTRSGAAPPPGVDGIESRLDLLAQFMEQANARVSLLEGERPDAASMMNAPAPEAPENRAEADAALAARLDTLEGQLDELQGKLVHYLMQANPPQREETRVADKDDDELAESRLGAEALARHQARVRDPTLDLYVRLSALRELRRFPAQMNAFGPVADEVVRLLRDPESGSKERIVDSVSETTEPRIVAELVAMLLARDDDDTRLEIVRALRPVAKEPAVLQALQSVAGEEKSRAQAAAARMVQDAAGGGE